jgi:hypothetical protein
MYVRYLHVVHRVHLHIFLLKKKSKMTYHRIFDMRNTTGVEQEPLTIEKNPSSPFGRSKSVDLA